ncbi:hypothetical protein [Paraliomyxa miuraensis]|uniref:hypothetical protein n=1 Tax=Paraliomyxa miuraensis TaxID=376150 RepID=UPI00225643F5|nr:hypothetical protein [Paraliomyxa miuraensis]MCX4245066.1 hypothetical protein [Paraliomyxa miuraensis]
MIALRHPGGTTKRWQHDAFGRVSAEVDARGNARRITRDALGRPIWIGMESSTGARQTITRNAMGDVVGHLARQGQQRWEAKIVRDAMGLEVDRQLPGDRTFCSPHQTCVLALHLMWGSMTSCSPGGARRNERWPLREGDAAAVGPDNLRNKGERF